MLDRAEIRVNRGMEVHRVAFIERVNLSARWYFYLRGTIKMSKSVTGKNRTYIRVCEDEFAQRYVKGVSIDTRPRGEDEIARGTVPSA